MLFNDTTAPARPVFVGAVSAIGDGGKSATVTFSIDGGRSMKLQPIHDADKIWGGVGCKRGAPGMISINASFDGGASGPKIANGTAAFDVNGSLVGTWTSPFMADDDAVVGMNITEIHDVRYLDNNVPTCVAADARSGRPLGPILHLF